MHRIDKSGHLSIINNKYLVSTATFFAHVVLGDGSHSDSTHGNTCLGVFFDL